jgi:hypothetical protein
LVGARRDFEARKKESMAGANINATLVRSTKQKREQPPAPLDRYESCEYPSILKDGSPCCAAEAIYFRAQDLLELHGDDSLEREMRIEWERLRLTDDEAGAFQSIRSWEFWRLYRFTEWSKLTAKAQAAALVRATFSKIDLSCPHLKGALAAVNRLYKADRDAVADFRLQMRDYISEDNLLNFFLVGSKYQRREGSKEPASTSCNQEQLSQAARLSGCLELISPPCTEHDDCVEQYLHPCYGEEEEPLSSESFQVRTPQAITTDHWGAAIVGGPRRAVRQHGRRLFFHSSQRCPPPTQPGRAIWAYRLPLTLKAVPLPGEARAAEVRRRLTSWLGVGVQSNRVDEASAHTWVADVDLLTMVLTRCDARSQRSSRLVCRLWCGVFDSGEVPVCAQLDWKDGHALLLGTAHLAPLLRMLDLRMGGQGSYAPLSALKQLGHSLAALSTLRLRSDTFGGSGQLLKLLRVLPNLRSLEIVAGSGRAAMAKADNMVLDDGFFTELADACPALQCFRFPLLTHEPAPHAVPAARKPHLTGRGLRAIAALGQLHELRIDVDTKPDRTGGGKCCCHECSAGKYVHINRPLALLDPGEGAWTWLFMRGALEVGGSNPVGLV